MRQPLWTVGAVAWLALAATAQPAEEKKAEAARVAKAKGLVEALFKEDWAAAGKDFDAAMKKALPEAKLKEIPAKLKGAVGAFRKQLGTRTETAGKYEVVYVTCDFEKFK